MHFAGKSVILCVSRMLLQFAGYAIPKDNEPNIHVRQMKKMLFSVLAVASMTMAAQELKFREAKFKMGDDPSYSSAALDDSKWETLSVCKTWDAQGKHADAATGWYRFHVRLTKSMLEGSDMKEVVQFSLGAVDDADETYLNGKLIGKTGKFPQDKGGYRSQWSQPRVYNVRVDSKDVRWGQDNVLAVRCYSGGSPGGMFQGPVIVKVPSRVDGLSLSATQPDAGTMQVQVDSRYQSPLSGTLTIKQVDTDSGGELSTVSRKFTVSGKKPARHTVKVDKTRRVKVVATFTEKKSGRSVTMERINKYILTPAAPLTPRFNTTGLFGVRPGSPVIFRFGVSGEKPMRFTAEGLPAGLALNSVNGALSGKIDKAGSYTFTVKASNAKGQAEQKFTIRVGSKIALTPPMGWNSWNCWGLSVTQDKVVSSAKALIEKGLADYGYAYINIDDAWEAERRNADGTIAVNEKFPDMKGLGDWLHSEGLKFGIYSSPGDRTCGGYLGSLDHERQDAQTYNAWGIDYLKYDWCGYGRKHATEKDNQTVASYVRPYLHMEGCLRAQPRDIFYSLCQYGMADVWKWGEAVDANSWRTTGDITDTWESMYDIGFLRNAPLHPYAQPGHWNDPDMLIVGKVGWSANLRDSRLTPDEQYTHISLWTLMASNMLIGCDIAQMDDFTAALLCNNEVNAVNQDILGKQAVRVVEDGDIQIFVRPLADGSHALGIFNVGSEDAHVDLSRYFQQIGVQRLTAVRDLWRQKDLSATALRYFVPTHGVKYLKVRY